MTILANMWRFAHRRGAKESQPDMIPTDDHGDSINRQPVVSSAGWVILSLIGTLWLALFSLWFLSQEEFIYSWDSSGHWHGWIRFCDRLTLNPVAILKDLFGSINHREYNDVANVLIALPGKLFGYELSVFAVSVVVGYILPFLLLLGWLIRGYFGKRNCGTLFLVASVVTFVTFPLLLAPVLRGYPGAIGLPLIVGMLLLMKGHRFLRFDPLRALALAALFLMLVFSRRWYGFWVVAFVAGMTVANVVWVLCGSKRKAYDLLCYTGNMAITGIVCVCVLVVLFRPFLARSLFVNYGDVYSAYATQSVWASIGDFLGKAGPLYVGLAGLGVLSGLVSEEKPIRHLVATLLVTLCLVLILACHTQSPSVQHNYLFIVPLIVFCGLGLRFLFCRCRYPASAAVLSSLLLVLLAVNWAVVFLPMPEVVPKPLAFLLSDQRTHPRIRKDVGVVRDLVEYLRKGGDGERDGRVYVAASSSVLNPDVLRKVEFPRVRDALPAVMRECSVDKRDGFPNHFFLADRVVVGEPVQLHLVASGQTVVTTLAQALISGKGVGAYYRQDKQFMLEEGVTARVYSKQEACERVAAERLKYEFQERYPDYPQLHVNPLMPLVEEARWDAEGGGQVRSVNGSGLFLHPSVAQPTELSFRLSGSYTNLAFTATFDNLAALANRPPEDAEVGLTVVADELVREFYVTVNNPQPVSLDLRSVERLTVQVDCGKHGPTADWFIMKDIVLK